MTNFDENCLVSDEEDYRNLLSAEEENAEEPVIAAVNTEALRKVLERRKRKQLRYPKGKTDPANLQLPGEWLTYEDGEPFVIYDAGKEDVDRFIILSSNFMLQKLVQAKTIAMDGTFKTRPRKWEQIFSVHVCNNNRFVTAVAVIMSKKNRASYLAVLQKLSNYMEDVYQIEWNPELLLTDFEIAQRSAIRSHFPAARHKCCYFHYAQAIQRWIAKVCEKCFSPSVEKQIILGWHVFLLTSKRWICKESEYGNLPPRFPVDLWNHREEALATNPTTTCALESWHRSINAATKERGQSMWKCLKLFKTKIGTISKNQWIRISSLSTPDRHETKVQREKLLRLQRAICSYNNFDPISGLKTIIRCSVEYDLLAGERDRSQSMAETRISQRGNSRRIRRRRTRNEI